MTWGKMTRPRPHHIHNAKIFSSNMGSSIHNYLWNKFQALCPRLCSYKTEVVEAAGPTPGHCLWGGKGILEGDLNSDAAPNSENQRSDCRSLLYQLNILILDYFLQWDIFLYVSPHIFIVWDRERNSLGTLATSHLKARWLRDNAQLRVAL